MRTETGYIQFGDDWRGIFIRGDNAYAMALTIHLAMQALEGRDDQTGTYKQLEGIQLFLSKVNQNKFPDEHVQKMKSFADCTEHAN
jgi:hypothetical protein